MTYYLDDRDIEDSALAAAMRQVRREKQRNYYARNRDKVRRYKNEWQRRKREEMKRGPTRFLQDHAYE